MQEKELIEETEWMRVYRLADNAQLLESKFLTDGLQVSAASIRQRWHGWTIGEQLNFANAFIAKPVLTAEDQEILKFLMEVGPEPVWCMIACLLPRYADRERALSFILERVASGGTWAGNYYRALETIGDAQAVSFLRERYEEYRRKLAPFEQQGLFSQLTDYLICCRALWKLSGSPEYQEGLKELLIHPDEIVRGQAHFYLYDQGLPGS
jgi:hypothetical protein